MDKFISIKEAGLLLGVTTTTLRRWESDGKLNPHHRTIGNHRTYELSLISPQCDAQPVSNKTVCYARVSTHEQKNDLTRQTKTKVLEQYTQEQNLTNVEFINEHR